VADDLRFGRVFFQNGKEVARQPHGGTFLGNKSSARGLGKTMPASKGDTVFRRRIRIFVGNSSTGENPSP
jgi:hypothetical protein